MNRNDFLRRVISLSMLSMIILVLLSQRPVQGLDISDQSVTSSIAGPTAYIMYDPNPTTVEKIAPPLNFLLAASPTADIQVNYNGAGWTTEAQTAFEYAANIWETQIVSSVPIVIDAKFENLSLIHPDILGGAGANNYYANFGAAPMANTLYAVAIANALENTDLYSGAEISASFNSERTDWYFGTDGNTPISKIDFASVVLHEIGHGLGFSGSMTIDDGNSSNGVECTGVNGIGCWGYGTAFPSIYDRYTENGSGQSLISDFPNNSSALAAQLKSNNVYFDATNANAANGGRVPLYAPAVWQQGSSYSHLAESFNGTPNSLMTYSLGHGESEHNPGPVMLGMFEDMGWTISANQPTAPVVSGLPMIELSAGQTFNNVIDLWAYTTDDVDADSDLTFQIISQSDPIANVTIDSNRYIDINPTDSGWEGISVIKIRVTDTDTLTTDAVFMINPKQVYLPMVISN
ncbi:MAG: hypothetical protein KC421_16585 [Anaerolineales bacterium]|nr:hypothetical protein [Anaerolineales bacterium]